MRAVLSSALTSSGMRFEASVFGRGEYLKENMLWYCAASVSESVVLEVRCCLARESHDHVRREGYTGNGLPNSLNQVEVFLARVATSHRLQDAGRSGLHGQVQVLADPRQVPHRLDQARAGMSRMRTCEANAINPWNGVDVSQELREVA